MEKCRTDGLPSYTDATASAHPRSPSWCNRRRKRRTLKLFTISCLAYLAYSAYHIVANTSKATSTLSIDRLRKDHATCASLRRKPVDVSETREYNKRWVNGTKPLLIRNATIWTGEPAPGTTEEDARAGKGWSWISSDVFINRGLIIEVARDIPIKALPRDTEVFEAKGRPLTAGIVDMHSHAGLSSIGDLQDDTNELSSDITPYVRSIDGLDPLQPEMEFIKSGGVTTSLFLPGSGNNMGGEAYVLKFAVGAKNGREEISQQDMLADPDKNWRYMKMACGENPKRVYGRVGKQGPYSRLGEAWEFRHALEQATKYVEEQDEWCAAADLIGVENMGTYLRQELEWESLGAVLRGQVRVNTHCYTIPDLEAFVRHTNEFKFRVYAFHHAHQTFLVPEVLKRAWGGPPAAALFADNMYYKVEAYRASERAGAILYAHNITPTYVSDNPVLNSQHVVFEAAKAYGYGLPYHAALAGVTSAPAELLGLGNRIGKIKEGFDADIVVWDSDPLSVGATPVQVWIDGAKQFKDPVLLRKPVAKPIEPDVSLVKESTLRELEGDVIFKGISHVHLEKASPSLKELQGIVAVVRDGKLACIGACVDELLVAASSNTPTISLNDGHITLPFTAFGTTLGLTEIDAERDTQDGPPPSEGVSAAVDGIQFGGKQLARAFEHGVTKAISAPSRWSIDAQGISSLFSTGAKHKLERGAILQDTVALHYPLTLAAKNGKTPSISSALETLKGKLLDAARHPSAPDPSATTQTVYLEKLALRKVVNGSIPLVLSAHSADTIASVITLKHSIEAALNTNTSLRIVIIGAAEAHLVANEIAAANISVVLAPLLPHAQSWDQRRCLTGAPLSNGTTINYLLDAGVLVGIGVEEVWETRDLNLLAGIAFANSEGRLDFGQALDLISTNIYMMLGTEIETEARQRARGAGEEWVIWEGSPLEIGGRIRGMRDRAKTFIWEYASCEKEGRLPSGACA